MSGQTETIELWEELRRIMDASGPTPQGLMAMALIQLNERLQSIEVRLGEIEEDTDRSGP